MIMKKVVFAAVCLLATFLLLTGCERQENVLSTAETETSQTSKSSAPESTTEEEKWYWTPFVDTPFTLVETPLVYFEDSIEVEESDKYNQLNYNMLNGDFIFPYKDGYYCNVSKEINEPDSEYIFIKGMSDANKYQRYDDIICIMDQSIYYIDLNGTLSVADFDGTTEFLEKNLPLYFKNDRIYMSTVVDGVGEFFSVDMKGKDKKVLLTLESDARFIIHNDRLWFSIDKLYSIRLDGTDLKAYPSINPEKMLVNNGHLYYTENEMRGSRLLRLELSSLKLQVIWPEPVCYFNFSADSLFFETKDGLWRVNDSRDMIYSLKGGSYIEGIHTEGAKIYIRETSHEYESIYELDRDGKIIKTIYKAE